MVETISRAQYRQIHLRLCRQPGIVSDWCLPRTSLFAIAFVNVTCPQAQDPLAYYNWFINEFWRFVFAHQKVGKYAQTFLEYPPMQEGASFNMYAERTQQVRE